MVALHQSSSYSKIDCHSHFVPPEYSRALAENGHKNPDGMPAIPQWSEELHLEMMEAVNVTKSILSITSPGTHLVAGDDVLGRNMTRYCNDYAADLKRKRPDKFGFFASLPFPDVQGSLDEIRRASEHLNPDGFTFLTNHHGVYLGDQKLNPVFDELNARHATVFIHPTTPCTISNDGCCSSAVPIARLPRPMFEFMFDTARTLIDLFLSGTVSRCPNITFIIPHMGGGFPPLMRRFATIPSLLGLQGCDPLVNPEWVKERLNTQFYFDTAGWPFPEQIHGLMEWVDADRMLYGSDFPFTPLAGVKALSDDHDRYLKTIFPKQDDQESLCSWNAERLLNKKIIKTTKLSEEKKTVLDLALHLQMGLESTKGRQPQAAVPAIKPEALTVPPVPV